MLQSKTESLIESFMNVLIGFVIGVISQMIIFPFFNITISISENIHMAMWFTVISLVRGYLIRRYFNQRLANLAHKISPIISRGNVND